MGLALVEFIMSVEDALGVSIPDAVAADLTTPGKLIDYLAGCLPPAATGGCLSQRAFYALRRAVGRHARLPGPCLRPDSSLLPVWPAADRPAAWAAVRQDLGARHWPRLAKRGWLSPRLHVAGDVARFLVARNPLRLKQPGEGWTRAQVAEVIHGQIGEELGIPRGTYTESSHWVEDMSVD